MDERMRKCKDAAAAFVGDALVLVAAGHEGEVGAALSAAEQEAQGLVNQYRINVLVAIEIVRALAEEDIRAVPA